MNQNFGEHIERPEQVQKLIEEFELDNDLKEKGRLGLDGKYRNEEKIGIGKIFLGFRNMLLSTDFDIVNPVFFSSDISKYDKGT